jgi:hypothetical protein
MWIQWIRIQICNTVTGHSKVCQRLDMCIVDVWNRILLLSLHFKFKKLSNMNRKKQIKHFFTFFLQMTVLCSN